MCTGYIYTCKKNYDMNYGINYKCVNCNINEEDILLNKIKRTGSFKRNVKKLLSLWKVKKYMKISGI